MRLLHLSDLHIGLRLYNHDLLDDQQYILDQVVEIAEKEKPDAVIIAGDIYDKPVPSADAVKLFDHFISGLTEKVPDTEIMMISGNHDSPARIDVYRRVLERQNIHMIGFPPTEPEEHIEKVVLKDSYGPVNFFLLPFVKPSMVKAIAGTDENGNNLSYDESVRRLLQREIDDGWLDVTQRNVLVSHQFYLPQGARAEDVDRMESEIVMVGNIDRVGADVLRPFDYAALGHIHKPMKAGSERWRYCGTPMPYSVSEAGQQKGILEVELKEKSDVSVRVLPLTSQRQVRVLRGSLEQMRSEKTKDYVRVVLTDTAYISPALLEELRRNLPNLLEIVRDVPEKMDYQAGTAAAGAGKLNPYELCRALIGDRAGTEELSLLREVINKVMEEQS